MIELTVEMYSGLVFSVGIWVGIFVGIIIGLLLKSPCGKK